MISKKSVKPSSNTMAARLARGPRRWRDSRAEALGCQGPFDLFRSSTTQQWRTLEGSRPQLVDLRFAYTDAPLGEDGNGGLYLLPGPGNVLPY